VLYTRSFSLADADASVASPAFEVGLPTLETPTLLHIGHPYALDKLQTLLTHVKNLRLFVGQLSARGENAQIARDVLVDLIDCSGFNIDAMCLFLAERIQDANTIPSLSSLCLVVSGINLYHREGCSKESGNVSANVCYERVPSQSHREVDRCLHYQQTSTLHQII